MLHKDGTSGCRLAPGPERPGQATFVRWKRCGLPRLSLQLPNPHEPRQCGLSHVDAQVQNRAKSDLHGSSESAGRCTPEVLQTDVLFVGLDDERPELLSDLLRNRGIASDTQQICARHSESTVRFDAEDHDACETLV